MAYKVPFVNYPLQYRNLKSSIDVAIRRVLQKGDLILRNDVDQFEKEFARFLGVKYAVGVSSGTDALIFSLHAAGIGPGDEVITVAHTFVASVAAIIHNQARPVLIDVRNDFTMNMDDLRQALSPRTKAVIPVHLNGRGCDMDVLMRLARKHKFMVIEDSAQALGAQFNKKLLGTFGLASCFSFYPAKMLGGYGDGGMVATNNRALYERCRALRSHGYKTKTEIAMYGYTGRLDNLQAAVLREKLKHLPRWIVRRREIALLYQHGLSNVAHLVLPPAPGADNLHYDVFQNYVIRASQRDALAMYLHDRGIETLIKDAKPLHHQHRLQLRQFKLAVTERLSGEVLSLPMYPELTNAQIDYVIASIALFYKNLSSSTASKHAQRKSSRL